MPHQVTRGPTSCAVCGSIESEPGSFPNVVGIGRVCMNCGMKQARCEECGTEVKLLTSSRLQGKTLCLTDYIKQIEKFRQHIVLTYDEDAEPATIILQKAYSGSPEGYTLLAVRRGRNSTHVWEAEYEKTELFEMRCS